MLKTVFILFFSTVSINCFSQSILQDSAVSSVDFPPEYPGGSDAFFRKINISFRVPQSLFKTSYQGKLKVHFTVDTEGTTILDSINFDKMTFQRKLITQRQKINTQEDLIDEFNRIFNRFPEWTPGSHNGVAIPVQYTLNFPLEIKQGDLNDLIFDIKNQSPEK